MERKTSRDILRRCTSTYIAFVGPTEAPTCAKDLKSASTMIRRSVVCWDKGNYGGSPNPIGVVAD